jgi:hypothetical protein
MIERGVQGLSQNGCPDADRKQVNTYFGIEQINKFRTEGKDRSYLPEHPRSGIEREGVIITRGVPRGFPWVHTHDCPGNLVLGNYRLIEMKRTEKFQ